MPTMPLALGAGATLRAGRVAERETRCEAALRARSALTTMSSMTTGLALACLSPGVAKPMAERALPALSVPTAGPTAAGPATTLLDPSAAFAVPANEAIRPPEAATTAAPFTAGWADSLAIVLSSEIALKRPGARWRPGTF